MGLKEFNEENVEDFESLIGEYRRTKEFISEKLQKFNKISFREFLDHIVPISS